MAGEVKYDSLPFIDNTGKDSFESGGDLIEPSYENYELKSEAVDHIQLNHAKSFGVFKDKYLDSKAIDFSDKILSSRNIGYESKSIYEILGEKVAKETPQQKYQRLQLELRELAEEVTEIKEKAKSESQDASPVPLLHQVKMLQKDLSDLHIEKVFSPEIAGNQLTESNSWINNVVSQLQTMKAGSSKTERSTEEGVVYEMYCKPETTRFAQVSRISDLESKLNEIEKYVGKDDDKMLSILADPSFSSGTLMETTASIQAKLSLLDISHVDIIAARLQGLLHAINEITQKKEKIENTDAQTKVDELHNLITSWDSVATVVPELIERLKSVHSLNEQATTFSHSLEFLQNTQGEIRDQLRTQKDMLDKFEKSFDENIKSIQSNCEALEKRVENIVKKVGS